MHIYTEQVFVLNIMTSIFHRRTLLGIPTSVLVIRGCILSPLHHVATTNNLVISQNINYGNLTGHFLFSLNSKGTFPFVVRGRKLPFLTFNVAFKHKKEISHLFKEKLRFSLKMESVC